MQNKQGNLEINCWEKRVTNGRADESTDLQTGTILKDNFRQSGEFKNLFIIY